MIFAKRITNFLIKKYLIKDKSLEMMFPMVVNNDHIGKQVIIDGYYELFFLKNLIAYLNPIIFENTVMDIGANIGNHSVFFSQYFREVLSFEPQKRTFKILSLNTEHIKNVIAHNFGLSDKSKNLTFKIHKMNFGNAKPSDSDKMEEDYFVEKVTLMPFEFKKNTVVSLIKIDVEGAECEFLKGLREKILTDKPILISEFNDAKTKQRLKFLLEEYGYHSHYVFKKELLKSPLSKLFSQTHNRLVKIDLINKYDFSMVISMRNDSEFKLSI